MRIVRWGVLLAVITIGWQFFQWSFGSRVRSMDLPPTVINVDCGRVQSRTKISRTVRIVNPTRSPLTVKRLISSCGCVEKSISSQFIKPGKDVDLSFGYKAADDPGKFQQHIDVAFEEPNSIVSVNLFGTVASWYTGIEGHFRFGEVVAGESSTEKLIEVGLEEDWQVADIQLLQLEPSMHVGDAL